MRDALRRRLDCRPGAGRESPDILPMFAASRRASGGVIRLQRPKARECLENSPGIGRVLAFRGPGKDRDAEIAELVALRNAWATGVRCIDARLADLEKAARERRKRRAR
jgi:hypothetical protein